MYGLSNLTTLIQLKNPQDIINYIFLMTATLNRLSLDPESCVKLQTQTRATLISAICQLDATNQVLAYLRHWLLLMVDNANVWREYFNS